MILSIGRNEKGKLVCWVPGAKGRLDGILVSDLVLTIPQSPLPYLQPVFGQERPGFEVKCDLSPEEAALVEQMRQAFAEKYQ